MHAYKIMHINLGGAIITAAGLGLAGNLYSSLTYLSTNGWHLGWPTLLLPVLILIAFFSPNLFHGYNYGYFDTKAWCIL